MRLVDLLPFALIIVLLSFDLLLGKYSADEFGEYNAFTVLLNMICYITFYSLVLVVRYWRGHITSDMLYFVWKRTGIQEGPTCMTNIGAHKYCVADALCDTTGQMMNYIARPYLHIMTMGLLASTYSLWCMLWSALMLGDRYTAQEFLGVGIALAGAIIPLAASPAAGPQRQSNAYFLYVVLITCGNSLYSLSATCKEVVFKLWVRRQKAMHQQHEFGVSAIIASDLQAGLLPAERSNLSGSEGVAQQASCHVQEGISDASLHVGPAEPTSTIACDNHGDDKPQPPPTQRLDVFCVASASSIWQLVWSLPVSLAISGLKKPATMSFARFFSNFWLCLTNNLHDAHVNTTTGLGGLAQAVNDDAVSRCTHAWQTYILYISVNLAFNVTLMVIYDRYSSVSCFVALKASSFVGIFLAQLPWPNLPRSKLDWTAAVGFPLNILGFVIFLHGSLKRKSRAEHAAGSSH